MFPVEIPLLDDSILPDCMTRILKWLDHRSCEPTTFRYTFRPCGMILGIDFPNFADAAAFAAEFGGEMISRYRTATNDGLYFYPQPSE